MAARTCRSYRYFLTCLFLTSTCVLPHILEARPSSPGPAEEAVSHNVTLSRDLSRRLGAPVVAYDTNWFHVIASADFEKEVDEEVAPNVVKAVAEFRNLFHFGRDERPPWNDERKGCLVLLKEREPYLKYVEIFEKAVSPERLDPNFTNEVARAQSFFWIEPWPYAVCCGEGAEWREMVQHVFHLLGHILLTSIDFNHKFAPPWLHEGYGAYMAIRFAGGNILYCTKGLNHCMFGTGVYEDLSAWARSDNWPELLCSKKLGDSMLSLEKLHTYRLADFAHQDVAQSWSFVSFLIEKHRDEFRAYMKALKAQPRSLAPNSDWPPETYSSQCFREAFGMKLGEIELHWKAWAEKELVHVDRTPRKRGEHTVQGCVRFDPAFLLEDFERLEGEEVGDSLDRFLKRTDEWMTPETLKAIRAEWAKVRNELLGDLERRMTRSVPGTEHLLIELASDPKARYLDEKAVLGLIRDDDSKDLIRAVIRYFVDGFGCSGAYSRLETKAGSGTAKLEGRSADEDLRFLAQAARFEDRLFEELARVEASTRIDCWPAKLRLAAVNKGDLVFLGKKEKSADLSDFVETGGITVMERDKEVEIHYPRARFDVKRLVNLGKSALKWKSSEDRIGYALLYLFRGDAAGFRSEMRFIKGREEEKKRLNELQMHYGRAEAGAGLLRFLTGDLFGSLDNHLEKLSSLMEEVKGSDLYERLKPRLEPVLRHWLFEYYLTDNRFLSIFKGFRSLKEGTGEARFLYEFNDPEEIRDFDSGETRLERALKVRYKVNPSIEAEPFRLQGGGLSCYGLDFLALKPVFAGDTELVVHLKVTRRKNDPDALFYCMFGYGLSPSNAYVASSCLTHLEIHGSVRGKYKLLEAGCARGAKGVENGCTIHLKGTTDRIVYRISDADESVFHEKGCRTGQVFMWVLGPRQFEIDQLEVKARIDPDWLIKAIETKVSKHLDEILEM